MQIVDADAHRDCSALANADAGLGPDEAYDLLVGNGVPLRRIVRSAHGLWAVRRKRGTSRQRRRDKQRRMQAERKNRNPWRAYLGFAIGQSIGIKVRSA